MVNDLSRAKLLTNGKASIKIHVFSSQPILFFSCTRYVIIGDTVHCNLRSCSTCPENVTRTLSSPSLSMMEPGYHGLMNPMLGLFLFVLSFNIVLNMHYCNIHLHLLVSVTLILQHQLSELCVFLLSYQKTACPFVPLGSAFLK